MIEWQNYKVLVSFFVTKEGWSGDRTAVTKSRAFMRFCRPRFVLFKWFTCIQSLSLYFEMGDEPRTFAPNLISFIREGNLRYDIAGLNNFYNKF